MRICMFLGFVFLFFGTPAFAQSSAKIPVEAFAQLPTTASMRLSPNGDYIAMSVPYNGRSHLIIKDFNSDNIVAVPPGNDADIAWFRWANNNRIVISYAFTSKRNSTLVRETRLFAVDRDGGNFKSLILPKKNVSSSSRLGELKVRSQIQDDVIDWLPEDPDHILLSIDSDLNGQDEVRKINVKNGRYDEITEGFRGIQNYRTDQNHRLRLGWGYDPIQRRQVNYIYFDPATKAWGSVKKNAWGSKGLFPISFSANPEVAYAGGLTKKGTYGVFKIDLSNGAVLETVFSNDVVDYDHIIYDPATNIPVGVQYTVDQPTSYYWDKASENLQRVIDKTLPDTINKIVSSVADQEKYLVFSHSDIEPGVYYFLDMQKKKLQFLSEIMPGLNTNNLAKTTAIHYDARDGLSIPAYITLPRSGPKRNLPFVIFPHGGPKARDTKEFDYFAQFFASRGYGVLQPNFRGSDGYGEKYADLGKRQWGGDMQNDVTDGVKYLIEQGIADPKRICIVGSSYGGYSAMMGAIKTPDLYKCAASINGVLNLVSLIEGDKGYIGGKAWINSMGLTGEKTVKVSPFHQVKKINIPILIIQAKDDFRIPYKQAVSMVKKLKRNKKNVQMVTLSDGDHNLDTAESRAQTLKALEAFLNQHLRE